MLRGSIEQPDQYLCEGDQPVLITVSNGSIGAGILYQWEQATGVTTNVFIPRASIGRVFHRSEPTNVVFAKFLHE